MATNMFYSPHLPSHYPGHLASSAMSEMSDIDAFDFEIEYEEEEEVSEEYPVESEATEEPPANAHGEVASDSSYEVNIIDFEAAPEENRDEIMHIVKKSIYDLPIEYHQQMMTRWGSVNPEQFIYYNRRSMTAERTSTMSQTYSLRSLRRGSSRDSILVTKKRTGHARESGASVDTRFKFLHPDVLRGFIERRTSFEFTRDIAIQVLTYNINSQLYVISKHVSCLGQTFRAHVEHKRVFSWAEDDFMKRRKIRNTAWIDILMKRLPADCLDNMKFTHDVMELIRYLNILMPSFLYEHDLNIESVINYIEESYDFLKIYENTEAELFANREVLRHGINKITDTNATRRNSTRRFAKLRYQEKLISASVSDPMEFRYKMNSSKINLEQYELSTEMKETKLVRAIDALKKKTEMENYVFQCGMNSHYTDIERIKERLVSLSAKYDMDLETVDNANNYIKISMDKSSQRKQYLKEQIARFHEELENIRLQAAEEEERERRLDEQLAQHIARLTAQNQSRIALKKAKKKMQQKNIKNRK